MKNSLKKSCHPSLVDVIASPGSRSAHKHPRFYLDDIDHEPEPTPCTPFDKSQMFLFVISVRERGVSWACVHRSEGEEHDRLQGMCTAQCL